jgi:hypothetical protein
MSEAPRIQVVGVESDLLSLLTNDDGAFILRAKFRLVEPRPAEALPQGDFLDVTISARVYESVGVPAPTVPHAEGPPVRRTARVNDWTVVDLELPPVPWREEGYYVTAKVYSHDERYRKSFDPSNCLVRQLKYGFQPT